MKKLYRFSAIALLVLPLVFTSCSDYLDRDDDDNITEADVGNMVVPIWLGMMRTIPSCAECGRIPPYGCRMAILLR